MASVVEIEDEFCFEMIDSYLENLPFAFFEGTGSILIASFVVFIAFKGRKNGLRYTAVVALLEYIILLYCSTVICRNTQLERKYDFHPFWTYFAIMEGKELYISEAIMNVIAFIPLGLLLGCSFHSITWWRTFIIGFLLSLGIETLQFWYMRGFSEVDDVMHNTMGCMIGYGIYYILRYVYEKFSKRRVAIL